MRGSAPEGSCKSNGVSLAGLRKPFMDAMMAGVGSVMRQYGLVNDSLSFENKSKSRLLENKPAPKAFARKLPNSGAASTRRPSQRARHVLRIMESRINAKLLS